MIFSLKTTYQGTSYFFHLPSAPFRSDLSDNERVTARAEGDGGVLARFAGDRLAQSLGGELLSEP